MLKLSLLIPLIFIFTNCNNSAKMETYLGVNSKEITQARDELLHTWYPKILDTKDGGYVTNFEYDWQESTDQTKMLVTQARGLWTAAKAAQVYPEEPMFRQAADHGYKFLIEKMWDHERTGFKQYVDDPQNDELHYKMTYGNAFALYALAEYAKINQTQPVKEWVQKSFDWMETHAHDPIHLGYFNLIINKPSKADPNYDEVTSQLGWGSTDWKDQNSSIHIMEALTTTYQVLPTAQTKARLEEMLLLVRDKMVNPAGHLHLFFTKDWQPINHADSNRTYIMEHLNFDHVSFGHDIETAYLLIEAAEVLYGKVDDLTLPIAKKLVDHSVEHGFDEDYYGLFDRGYRFEKNGPIEIVRRDKVWWAQAEAWHTFSLMHEYFPEETIYQQGFEKMWTYIQTELMDKTHGGWYAAGLDENPESKTRRKAHQWKGAYHDGRALIQVANRMQ